jgi:Ca-activated chloride channel family protein
MISDLIHFGNPKVLGFLFLLPAIWMFLWRIETSQRDRVLRWMDRPLIRKLIPEWRPLVGLRKGVLQSFSLGFMILALARPQWGEREEVIPTLGLDLVVALDLSKSMEVEDVIPNRLLKAKHFLNELSMRIQGDRLGLIGFAGSAVVASPLTTDLDYFREQLDLLTPQSIGAQGTDIGVALKLAVMSLLKGSVQGETRSDSANEIPSTQILLLITDGEDHGGEGVEQAQKLRERGGRVFVVGIGTEEGGPIPSRDDRGQVVAYRRDKKGQLTVSRLVPETLESLAKAGAGKFYRLSDDERELDDFLNEVGVLRSQRDPESESKRRIVREEQFQIPLALALVIFLVESLISRRNRSLKFPTSVVTLSIILLIPRSESWARELGPRSFYENFRAGQAWRQGDSVESTQRLGEAQTRDLDHGLLWYNQGVLETSKAEKGTRDFSRAQTAFREAIRSSHDPWVRAQAQFNLGLVETQRQDLKAAALQYRDAIQTLKALKPTPEVEGLLADARKNLELLQNERQKQKSEQGDPQSQGGEKPEQTQDPGKGEGKDQKLSPDPGKGKEQKDTKQFEDATKSRQKYRSQKLSQEDAEKVMRELIEKEKQLSEKMRRQKSRSESMEKDW